MAAPDARQPDSTTFIHTSQPYAGPHSAPPTSPTRIPNRNSSLPIRSSTLSSPRDFDRPNAMSNASSHSRSEDLNHTGANGAHSDTARSSPSIPSHSPSRPMTPLDTYKAGPSYASENGKSDTDEYSQRRRSSDSSTIALSVNSRAKTASTNTTASTVAPTICVSCSLPLEGAFVRALGAVWHLQCFKCKDCGDVVASKFFPIDAPDGKQQPLCERDYFRRLGLICVQCGQALRGSYITACNKKFHVEHFTCSVCPTLFGPQDSYYEHEGDVYCHLHYSTRFATKCAGCNTAILKQFVEINRNNRDECWHPECYMINKFWNVKIASRAVNSPIVSKENVNEDPWAEEERRETAASLKEKQVRMEQQVYRIWTVLSAFEESSAACISDMLRHVSNAQYLEALRMAEKFILHVEVLFATIDDLETYFTRMNVKGMSHVREARLLCRKTVDLFSLLSHSSDTASRRTGMTQELLALVTSLAHYLKILIRIALTGGLKLERDYGIREALVSFLDKLHFLAVEGGNPGARRLARGSEKTTGGPGGAPSTQGVIYGYRSLAPESLGDLPFGAGVPREGESSASNSPSDLCVKCRATVEEDCVRLGTYQRWHSHCIQCQTCGKAAGSPVVKEPPRPQTSGEEKEMPKPANLRRLPANTEIFVWEVDTAKETDLGQQPKVILCTEHQHPGCMAGFQPVSRLEQYAYLLNVALRRLFNHLKRHGIIPATVASIAPSKVELSHEAYRDSSEIIPMKSVHLDRKLSATAHYPKRSTIVESPSGRMAQPTDFQHSPRMTEVTTPSLPSQRGQVYGAQQPVPSMSATFNGPPVRPSRNGTPSLTHPLVPSPPSQYQPPPQLQSQGPPPPRLRLPPGSLTAPADEKGQIIRPHLSRNNTEVMIVDDSVPNSPVAVTDDPMLTTSEEGITLADIPQVIEVEKARAQRRSLPSQNATPYIAELSPLQLSLAKHAAVLALFRSPLRNELDLEDTLELLENKKERFWNKIFKSGGKPKKGVFGVPLEILLEREGADSMLGVSRATLRIPSFIEDVVSAMRQMDMSVEGIFRKNGNIRGLNDLIEAIDRDPSSVDLTQDNPVQLAALLKKFLKALPEPLMTFKLYRLFMAAENLPNEDERKHYLHLVMLLLPKGNRDTVEVLFVFLKWVASFAHVDEVTGNKMDLHNLATVISPNIFRSKAGNDSVRVESFEGIRVMDTLLENQDEFYTVPTEFLGLLHDRDQFANCLEMPSKDLIKKIGDHLRVKATNGRPGLASPIQGISPFGPAVGTQANLPPFGRDGSEPRLTSHNSDPALGRGRQGAENSKAAAGFDKYPPASSQSLDRPPPNAGVVDNGRRNNQSPSRQHSPHPPRLPHSPFSMPVTTSAGSLAQGGSILSSMPKSPNPQYDDWFQHGQMSQTPPVRPSSRPVSISVGDGGEYTPTSSSYTQTPQLRQRT